MSEEISPIELFLERASLGALRHLELFHFPLQNNDYVVSSYAKAGTTWVQQIVHQLRTGGDESFQEISLVIPFLIKIPAALEQAATTPFRPRVFKTHSNYKDIVPQGGKHIYTTRDPEDTFWSAFHFFPSALATPGIKVEDFYFRYFRDAIPHFNYWRHNLGWWEHRNDPNILFLHFEDLKENREHCIRHIANFMNIPLTNQLLDVVMERSSYQYMKENAHLFDARFEIRNIREDLGIVDDTKALGKVREGGGEVGQGKKNIPQSVRDDMEKVWEEIITPATGCKNYAELRAGILHLFLAEQTIVKGRYGILYYSPVIVHYSSKSKKMAEELSQIDLYLKRALPLASLVQPFEFPLQDDDYTVTSYAKAGTTWIQQIVHQLRTGGDESFDEISLVVPFLTPDPAMLELIDKLPFRPRVFKTHFNYQDIVPQGGKHIYTTRNPEDTFWSVFHFFPPFVCTPGVAVEDLYFRYFRDAVPHFNYWRNNLSWWQHWNDPNILFLHFEDLKENREHCIRHIANFMNIPLTDQLLDVVMERSSYQYMKENGRLFDARFEIQKFREFLGIMDDTKAVGKVREGGGEVGQGKKNIPQSVRDDMEKVWEEIITPATGCKNYAELRAKSSLLNKPL